MTKGTTELIEEIKEKYGEYVFDCNVFMIGFDIIELDLKLNMQKASKLPSEVIELLDSNGYVFRRFFFEEDGVYAMFTKWDKFQKDKVHINHLQLLKKVS